MAGGLVVLVTAAVIFVTLFLVLRSAGGLNMIRELAAEQPEFVQAAQILGGTAVLIVALSLPLIGISFSAAALAASQEEARKASEEAAANLERELGPAAQASATLGVPVAAAPARDAVFAQGAEEASRAGEPWEFAAPLPSGDLLEVFV